jgi:hypothetical protein
MKKALMLVLTIAIATLGITLTFGANNVNLDGVLLGEEGPGGAHLLQNWGPTEPDTHPGGWGGAPPGEPYCRTIWGGIGYDNDNHATVTLDGKGSARTIRIHHLNGVADDSFDVFARRQGMNNWIFIGHYTWSWLGDEEWKTTDFDLHAAFTAADVGVGLGKPLEVKLVATAPAWTWQHIYGQVGIHEIILVGNGQPGY